MNVAGYLGILTLAITPTYAQALTPVYVATYFDIQPAHQRQAMSLVAQYGRQSRKDSGNLREEVLQEEGRASRFLVIEDWTGQSSFDQHEKADHTIRFRDALKSIQRAPQDQRVTHPFAVDPHPEAVPKGAIFAVTHFDVPGPRKDEAEVILKRLAAATWNDTGRVRYDIYQQGDPRLNHFTVVAVWKDSKALDAHGATPHSLQFREAAAPMLGALYDERLYRLLAP